MSAIVRRLERVERAALPPEGGGVVVVYPQFAESEEACLRREGKFPCESGVTYIFVSYVEATQ